MMSISRLCSVSLFLVLVCAMPTHAARNLDKGLEWPGTTLFGAECRGKASFYGPFDYTDPKYTVEGNYRGWPLYLVEKAHFTKKVERLIRGHTSKDPMPDIDYTLRAFPNHHRALYSMMRDYLRKLADMTTEDSPKRFSPFVDGFAPAECYFQRAAYFAPEDGIVRLLFGIYLHRRGELDAALQQYKAAEQLLPPHAELYYNRGLLHYDRGEYAEAQQYADKAYEMNYQLPGLRRKLEELER